MSALVTRGPADFNFSGITFCSAAEQGDSGASWAAKAEPMGAMATALGAMATALGAMATALGAMATALSGHVPIRSAVDSGLNDAIGAVTT